MSLAIVGATHRFGAERALDDVSVHVRDGDCYGLVGHNGAGKTTLLRVLLGLLRPDRGRVLVDGFDAARHQREARARIGALAEFPSFYGTLSGLRNLLLFARLAGLPAPDAQAAADRCLEWTGLARAARKPVRAYSQGMRRRLGIALALVAGPRHLVLDEPANGLDPDGMAEMRELFRRLGREQGLTILLSSHLLAEVEGLCNRVGILREGRLLVEAETSTLLAPTGARYRILASPDGAEPAAALRALALEAVPVPGGGVDVDLGPGAPAAMLERLLAAGVRITGFSPRPRTLEEIYLELRGGGVPAGPARPERSAPEAARATALTESTAPAPDARLSPARAVGRVLRFELARALRRPAIVLVLLVPALAGALNIVHRERLARADAEGVGRDLASTTGVTAFEAVGFALTLGLPLLVLVLAGLASQAVAGDVTRGTLRNILLAPVRRADVLLGKVLATFTLGLAAWLALAGGALAVAGAYFDFGDVAEILPNGLFPLLSADVMWPELRRVLWVPLLPLAAYAAVGFLAGTLARGATAALGLAFGAVIALDLARPVVAGVRREEWLPSTYLPSALGDRSSFVQYYTQLSQAFNDVTYAYAGTETGIPAAWAAGALALAFLVFLRRPVS